MTIDRVKMTALFYPKCEGRIKFAAIGVAHLVKNMPVIILAIIPFLTDAARFNCRNTIWRI